MVQLSLWGHIYTIFLQIAVVFELFSNLLDKIGFNTRNRANLPKSLEGKVVVITGANSGIGKVVATTFAKLGASVVMACRDSDKSRKCFNEILGLLPDSKKKNLTLKTVDMSSLESVRSCAEKINSSVPKIDCLINNAGIMMCPELKSKEGYELHIATNHLGHFLLTNLLLDKLKAAPSARVITITSVLYLSGKIHFGNINLNGQYSPVMAYAQSKLANALFARELAKRLKGTNVTSYAVHPGVIDTGINRHVKTSLFQILYYTFQLIIKLFYINEELGAQTTLFCALDDKLEKESGFYYSNCNRVDGLAPNAIDDQDAAKLWKLSEELCSIKKSI